MLNWVLRYQPVIRLLNEFGATDVLDVGAGWHGLSRWWPHHVVQTDLSFSGAPPRSMKRAGTVEFVPASAEALPFDDGQFDFAISLDMVEHLPEKLRAPSIKELARVSRRGFIIGYPVGEVAHSVDIRLHQTWTRRGVVIDNWLVEHLAQDKYPDRSTLENALPDGYLIEREVPSGNAVIQRSLVNAETLPVIGRALRRAEGLVTQFPSLTRPLDFGSTYRTIWYVQPDSNTQREQRYR